MHREATEKRVGGGTGERSEQQRRKQKQKESQRMKEKRIKGRAGHTEPGGRRGRKLIKKEENGKQMVGREEDTRRIGNSVRGMETGVH